MSVFFPLVAGLVVRIEIGIAFASYYVTHTFAHKLHSQFLLFFDYGGAEIAQNKCSVLL